MTWVDDMTTDLEERGMVKACPVCYREVLIHCYHPDDYPDGEVKTVEMVKDDQRRKRYAYLTSEIEELDMRIAALRQELEEVAPRYVLRHVHNGYLKRRGHSDEPSLNFVENPEDARQYERRESPQSIIDAEVRAGSDPDNWVVEEILR